MESAQTLDVDRPVVHPDDLPDAGAPIETKETLIDQVESSLIVVGIPSG